MAYKVKLDAQQVVKSFELALGDRLKMLEETGIIKRGEDDVKKSRVKYSLTQKGIDMLPFMIDIMVWSGMYDKDTEAGKVFLRLATNNRDSLIASSKEDLEKEHLLN